MNHGPLLPTTGDKPEPPAPATKQRSAITSAKARKAAEAAGMAIVNIEGLEGMGVLGEFVGATGAIKIGRAQLAFAAQNYDRAMTELRDLLARDSGKAAEDDELRYNIARALKDVVDSYSENAMRLIESAAHEPQVAAEGPKRQAGFSPPPIGVAVTVNTGGEKPAVTVESSQEA